MPFGTGREDRTLRVLLVREVSPPGDLTCMPAGTCASQVALRTPVAHTPASPCEFDRRARGSRTHHFPHPKRTGHLVRGARCDTLLLRLEGVAKPRRVRGSCTHHFTLPKRTGHSVRGTRLQIVAPGGLEPQRDQAYETRLLPECGAIGCGSRESNPATLGYEPSAECSSSAYPHSGAGGATSI